MTSDNAALLAELTAGHQKLTGEWKRRDLPACTATLAKLRTQLASSAAEAAFLPAEAISERKKELLLARDVLEIGAQLSVAAGDDAAFERYIAQLKTHYVDYADTLPESAYQ